MIEDKLYSDALVRRMRSIYHNAGITRRGGRMAPGVGSHRGGMLYIRTSLLNGTDIAIIALSAVFTCAVGSWARVQR